MAHLQPSQNTPALLADPESDYGSDLDDAVIDSLLSNAQSLSQRPPQPQTQPKEPLYPVLKSTEDPVLQDAPPSLQRYMRFAPTSLYQSSQAPPHPPTPPLPREPSIEIEYAPFNRGAFSRTSPPLPPSADRNTDAHQRLTATTLPPDPPAERSPSKPPANNDAPEQPGDDPRSPLFRFRTPPKKPLSVTDLVSPAWCEQQYWYSLTKYGRVRKTPAMKQGSSVHKVLEEQVHREVKVEVVSREDAFGLRIWNVIQGLRTLRATGMTRELEVWGMLEGEVVNGIIDEVGTTCPDEEADEKMLADLAATADKVQGGGKRLKANQQTLNTFLTSSPHASTLEPQSDNNSAWLGALHPPPQTFYLTDIKTRQSKSLPALGSPSKPTHIQLQLYRFLLSSLASGLVPASRIFERYRLDPEVRFSDTFIAEVSRLDFNFPDDVADADLGEVKLESPRDSLAELLAHNSLSALWTFMLQEFARTIPTPSASLSRLLTAEYRSPSSGSLIGTRTFTASDTFLEAYVKDEMKWWRGERATKGVEIEDAFKCGFCEFAVGCSWRAERVDEGVRKARLRREREGRKGSQV